MDIAKYIGLFLIKNEQCYVNGLGTLQIVRKPATYDGQYLNAGTTEINVVPGGNVDESLANYIATNEQISITKAVAAVKEYSAEAKNQLLAGQTIALPFLGKLMAEDGRIGFITDPHLQFQGPNIAAKKGIEIKEKEKPAIPHQPFIPSTPVGAAATPPPGAPPAMPKAAPLPTQPQEPEGDRINWLRLIFVLLFLLVLAAGAYYAYMRYFAPRKSASQSARPALTIPDEIEDFPEEENTVALIDSTAADTMAKDTDMQEQQSAATPPVEVKEPEAKEEKPKEVITQKPVAKETPPPADNTDKIKIKVVVNTFDSKSEAFKRKNQLIASGVKADVIEEDVNYYFVVIPVKASPDDTGQILKNMTNKYNKEGVFVY